MQRGKMRCPNCQKDITDTLFEKDPSEVSGFIDIGYECEDCGIEVYVFVVKYIKENNE